MKIAEKVQGFNRNRKWGVFNKHILFEKSTQIIDVGFNDIEYSAFDNYLEKKYPYQQNITALGVVGKNNFNKNYPLVNAVLYDGKNFPFSNKSFDVCWSNAVIEHVGGFAEQLYFIKEMFRVSNQVFFTTPNRFFPIEVHTRTPLLHIISSSLFEKYLKLIGKSWATGSYMNLLSKKQLVLLMEKANVTNYKIIRDRVLCFTLDFVVIINP